MKKIGLILVLTSVFLMPFAATVQAGLVPGQPYTGFDPGNAVDDDVVTIALQPDGKVLIGGWFTKGIARLNRDGSMDTSFNIGSGANGWVRTIIVQPDGKLIISGDFTEFNGVERNKITRLNNDGSLDTSFNSGSGTDSAILVSALQPDEKTLIAGEFTEYDGNEIRHIARLQSDGTLDPSFDPGVGPSALVHTMAIQPDGKVIIGGYFTKVSNVNYPRVARLNADGSLDDTFNSGEGPDAEVRSVVLQPDGKVLIGGVFTKVDGQTRNRVARLNANGTLDASFDPGDGPNASVNVVVVLQDGKILIGGGFAIQKGALIYNKIARLDSSGTLDTTYFRGAKPDNQVKTILLQPDGKFLIGGAFIEYAGVTRNFLARINPDGSLDSAFDAGDSTDNYVYALALQPDGKIIVGGIFTKIAGNSRERVGRLYANGIWDSTFDSGTDIDVGSVNTVAIQPDGKVLLGGSFPGINGGSCRGLGRLDGNGSHDASFNVSGIGIGDSYADVKAMALDMENKIIIGGSFTSYNGTGRNKIARINQDGTLDSSFDPGTGASNAVNAVAVQHDGKVIIGGLFTSVNGVARNRIARLNSDGSVDTSFNPGSGVGVSSVNAIALQADGKVLIGGYFSQVDGVTRVNIARLNKDGSLDMSFETPDGGVNEWVLSIVVQGDGKIIIGGTFTMVSGEYKNRVARLNADGSLDLSFDTGGGPDATVWSMAFQKDGSLVLGGNFEYVACYKNNHIARLNAAKAPTITSAVPPASAKVGFNYSHSFTALGHPAVSLFQVIDGKLPGGLLLDPRSGSLFGEPNETGEFNLTIAACNYAGPCDTQILTIIVKEPPTITSPDNATFIQGQVDSFTIMTKGDPIPEITFSGSLPDGVTFDDTGDGTALLSGTPGQGSAGEYVLEITADNGVLPNAIQNFTLTVKEEFEETSIFLPLILR